ncbi:MAG: GtrA family protein [Paenibacillus sp.]|jgi:putative flippase GtrA|nr:GtrA family protein [Paenibacillus sp.]
MKWTKLIDSSFLRFLLVGVFNTIVGLTSIYILLHVAHIGYWPATFLGNTIGALVSYTLNKKFTFRSDAKVGGSMVRFLIVTLVCYGLSYGIGLVGGQLVTTIVPWIPETRAHDVATLLGTGLYVITNYLGHKYFSFRTSRPVERQAGESS